MKSARFTLGVLIILTLISAVISNSQINYASEIILLLAGLKFIGIAFYFMGLIKAHVFWRAIISFFVCVILVVILVIY